MNGRTNISELAYCLSDSERKSDERVVVRGVAPRFVVAGETREQALERQRLSLERIKARVARSTGSQTWR